MSVILTPELEAEVTAIYQEIRAAQVPAAAAIQLRARAVVPTTPSQRVGTTLFAALAVLLAVVFPAWILMKVIGLLWSR